VEVTFWRECPTYPLLGISQPHTYLDVVLVPYCSAHCKGESEGEERNTFGRIPLYGLCSLLAPITTTGGHGAWTGRTPGIYWVPGCAGHGATGGLSVTWLLLRSAKKNSDATGSFLRAEDRYSALCVLVFCSCVHGTGPLVARNGVVAGSCTTLTFYLCSLYTLVAAFWAWVVTPLFIGGLVGDYLTLAPGRCCGFRVPGCLRRTLEVTLHT